MRLIKGSDTTYAQIPNFKEQPAVQYRYVEQMPLSAVDLDSFIKVHLQYPADALAKKVQGRVVVTFTVDNKGTVVNAHVSHLVYPSLDKEAVRLIRSLPVWQAGSENGKNISVELSWPVVFKL